MARALGHRQKFFLDVRGLCGGSINGENASSAGVPLLGKSQIITCLMGLTPLEKVRLDKAARFYSRGTDYAPGDLFNESVRRMLDGDRAVPSNIPFALCIKQAMRSIASAWRKTHLLEAHEVSLVAADGTELQVPANEPTAEQALISAACRAQLERDGLNALEGDEEAQMVLMARIDGDGPDDIQAALGITSTQYANALRRIRRTIDKKFPEGWKP